MIRIVLDVAPQGAGWLPVVQAAVTFISALIAGASAGITWLNFRASRRDRIQKSLEDIASASAEIWKLEKSIDRCVEALNPMIASGQRERLRASAIAETKGVTAKPQWPTDVEIALVEIRRIIEDADPSSSEPNLRSAISKLEGYRPRLAAALERLDEVSAGRRRQLIGKASSATAWIA